MKKEQTQIQDIKLIGITARTNNQIELAGEAAKIGPLVGKYFQEQVAQEIPSRLSPGVTYSSFTDYENDYQGDYTYFIGEAVESLENIPEGFESLTIPAGKYCKFTTPSGPMPQVIIDTWHSIWGMSASDLGGERAYQTDFEVYDERACDPQNTVADIYIGVK